MVAQHEEAVKATKEGLLDIASAINNLADVFDKHLTAFFEEMRKND